jgi:hypothetical protein
VSTHFAVQASRLAADARREADRADAKAEEAERVAWVARVAENNFAGILNSMAKEAEGFFERGRYMEAEEGFRKVLAIRRKILGEEHPHTAQSYNNVAANLWRRQEIGQAVRLLEASMPGQEAARFHGANSGFDRAIATGKKASPHALLALGLAHLKEPNGAFRHAEASLARGLLDDRALATAGETREAASLRALLDLLDRQLLPRFGRATLSAEQKAVRYENLLRSPARPDLKKPLPRAEALEEARRWLRELPRRDAEALAAALRGGKLGGTVTRGTVVELDVGGRTGKLPAGERPYAHPFYWAAFVLVGDPD